MRAKRRFCGKNCPEASGCQIVELECDRGWRKSSRWSASRVDCSSSRRIVRVSRSLHEWRSKTFRLPPANRRKWSADWSNCILLPYFSTCALTYGKSVASENWGKCSAWWWKYPQRTTWKFSAQSGSKTRMVWWRVFPNGATYFKENPHSNAVRQIVENLHKLHMDKVFFQRLVGAVGVFLHTGQNGLTGHQRVLNWKPYQRKFIMNRRPTNQKLVLISAAPQWRFSFSLSTPAHISSWRALQRTIAWRRYAIVRPGRWTCRKAALPPSETLENLKSPV